ncbi:right-handed parallel beta-helix repeat-containing protein [Luteimonas sp. MC1895]|uniref:right-handed parallel beta-helix repeat-containing protein n=1 Tax=Luteimonas sp. MC1895 TaxID=2819513 RepID=UPI0018F0F407|nr:right-handed parallel beta-helix repeat-containing protein [Luteimonas sp. MC1895]MBJ6978237.1 right-handed parallel beta-helix repeat-containing protein [Luteimonas sp. MC1895]
MRLCSRTDLFAPAHLAAGGPASRPSRRLPPKRHLLASATFLLATASVPGFAAEWFVSTAGNDSSGNGSLQNPFRTIKRATSNSVSSAGDTVTVRGPAGNATYNECEVRLRHRLVLRAYPGERPRIHCNDMSNDVAVRIDVAGSGSRVSGFEISGGYYGVMLMTNWYQGGPSGNHGARDVVLEDLLVHHTGFDGIKVTPKSDNATIRRVEIHTTGAGYPAGTPDDDKNADGIDNVNGSGMVVEDSYIHDTATTGLYFKGGAADVVIQRNRIENTGDAGILVGFDTSPQFFDLQLNPGYYEAIRGIVRNNVVRNTGYAGIGLYASRDSVVANNTIINAARRGHAALYFGVTFQDWADAAGRPANRTAVLRNNLVIQDGGRCIDIRHSSELGGLSGLVGAPDSNFNGFPSNCTFRDGRPGSNLGNATLAQWRAANGADVNSTAASFSVSSIGHLPAGSPAIDRGVALAQVLDDVDGDARPVNYDIGADEFRGPVVDEPAPPPPPRDRRRRRADVPMPPPDSGNGPGSRVRDIEIPADRGRNPGPGPRPRPPGVGGATVPASAPDVRITPPVMAAWERIQSWIGTGDARDAVQR